MSFENKLFMLDELVRKYRKLKDQYNFNLDTMILYDGSKYIKAVIGGVNIEVSKDVLFNDLENRNEEIQKVMKDIEELFSCVDGGKLTELYDIIKKEEELI